MLRRASVHLGRVVRRDKGYRLNQYAQGLRLFSSEEHEFQAETKKLLDIVTHSIYTDKEVFLRELISNASDALEKLRYSQTTGAVAGDGEPLAITVTTDKEAGTLTIADTGIGNPSST